MLIPISPIGHIDDIVCEHGSEKEFIIIDHSVCDGFDEFWTIRDPKTHETFDVMGSWFYLKRVSHASS